MLPRGARHRSFRLDPEREPADVLDRLGTSLHARVRSEPRRHAVLYDTFDHRLAKRGATLWGTREGDATRLVWDDGGAVREARASRGPDFADSLPAGPIREELAPLLDVRRLLPTVELDGATTVVDVLDRREKTVARVHLASARARDPLAPGDWRDLPPFLWVAALRGYDREFEDVCALLRREPGLREAEQGAVAWALGDVAPLDPASWRPELPSGVRADVGLMRVHAVLLRQMLAWEPGTRADLDSEFLHDFRVAIRRARSLLTQVKRVLPDGVVARFREEFAWLGRATGPARDLDVLLLDLARWPAGLAEGELERVRHFVREEQREARCALLEALDSERYAALVADWRRFLAMPLPARPFGRDSHRPLREVAGERILRLHRRILRRGREIGRDAPASALHALRIDCKKMRYLIDGTREVWDAGVGDVVRRTKALQNVLGAFNDRQVQAARLAELGRRMAERGSARPDTLLTLGRMVEQLEVKSLRERGRFAERWSGFASKGTRRAVAAVFGAGDDAGMAREEVRPP